MIPTLEDRFQCVLHKGKSDPAKVIFIWWIRISTLFMLSLDRLGSAFCLLCRRMNRCFSGPTRVSFPRPSISVGGLLCQGDSLGVLPRLFVAGGVHCNSPVRDDVLDRSSSPTVACCGPEPSEVQLRCGANDAMDRPTGSRGALPFAPLKPYPIIAILGSDRGFPLGGGPRRSSIRLARDCTYASC